MAPGSRTPLHRSGDHRFDGTNRTLVKKVIEIPSKVIAGLIGPSGRTVAALRTKTGASISFGESNATISGTAAQVSHAEGLIRDSIASMAAQNTRAPPRDRESIEIALNDSLVDDLDIHMGSIAATAAAAGAQATLAAGTFRLYADGAAAAATLDRALDAVLPELSGVLTDPSGQLPAVCRRTAIPTAPAVVAHLIGRNGSTVKRIRSEFDVFVYFDKGSALIRGALPAVRAAADTVQSMVARITSAHSEAPTPLGAATPSGAATPTGCATPSFTGGLAKGHTFGTSTPLPAAEEPGDSEDGSIRFVRLPPYADKYFASAGAAHVARIRTDHGVNVGAFTPYKGTRFAVISSPEKDADAVARATTDFVDLLDGFSALGLVVPAWAVGRIIGKAGEGLKRLETQVPDVAIFFPSTDSQFSESVCVLAGAAEAAAAARRHLIYRLASVCEASGIITDLVAVDDLEARGIGFGPDAVPESNEFVGIRFTQMEDSIFRELFLSKYVRPYFAHEQSMAPSGLATPMMAGGMSVIGGTVPMSRGSPDNSVPNSPPPEMVRGDVASGVSAHLLAEKLLAATRQTKPRHSFWAGDAAFSPLATPSTRTPAEPVAFSRPAPTTTAAQAVKALTGATSGVVGGFGAATKLSIGDAAPVPAPAPAPAPADDWAPTTSLPTTSFAALASGVRSPPVAATPGSQADLAALGAAAVPAVLDAVTMHRSADEYVPKAARRVVSETVNGLTVAAPAAAAFALATPAARERGLALGGAAPGARTRVPASDRCFFLAGADAERCLTDPSVWAQLMHMGATALAALFYPAADASAETLAALGDLSVVVMPGRTCFTTPRQLPTEADVPASVVGLLAARKISSRLLMGAAAEDVERVFDNLGSRGRVHAWQAIAAVSVESATEAAATGTLAEHAGAGGVATACQAVLLRPASYEAGSNPAAAAGPTVSTLRTPGVSIVLHREDAPYDLIIILRPTCPVLPAQAAAVDSALNDFTTDFEAAQPDTAFVAERRYAAALGADTTYFALPVPHTETVATTPVETVEPVAGLPLSFISGLSLARERVVLSESANHAALVRQDVAYSPENNLFASCTELVDVSTSTPETPLRRIVSFTRPASLEWEQGAVRAGDRPLTVRLDSEAALARAADEVRGLVKDVFEVLSA